MASENGILDTWTTHIQADALVLVSPDVMRGAEKGRMDAL